MRLQIQSALRKQILFESFDPVDVTFSTWFLHFVEIFPALQQHFHVIYHKNMKRLLADHSTISHRPRGETTGGGGLTQFRRVNFENICVFRIEK